MSSNILKLGIPKGSLEEATVNLFAKAGYNIKIKNRSYFPSIDDNEIECLLIRAQEIARYVENGVLDAGPTGKDWVQENRADVVEIADLVYSKTSSRPVRWVLAVPNESPIQSIKDLQGKRIATEAVNMTVDYLKKHGVTAAVEFSWGFFEVYFVGGHLDEYLGFRYGIYDEPCPLRCIIIFWQYYIYYVPVLFVHTVQPTDQGQNHLCTK